MTTRIIEPPVRSRPFRHFRGPNASPRRLAPTSKRVNLVQPTNVHQQYLTPSAEQSEYRAPVRAVHVGQSIDLAKVISKVFATKSVRKMIERLSVVVQLQPPPMPEEHQHQHEQQPQQPQQHPRFVAVFRFGSVVFFNVPPQEAADLLWEIKQFVTSPALSGSERKENYCVLVQPNLESSPSMSSMTDTSSSSDEPPDIVTGDYCIVPELNLKAVDVISSTIAQSVALDSYSDTVDALLAKFEKVNKKVTLQATAGGGGMTTLDRDEMFRAVAQNNSIFIEMISKVGIKDRIDTAWNLSQYEEISEGMREEFDIDLRFEHIEFKLNLIQQNAKFFLEVLAHQKSNSLEWIIIVLITFECVLMCAEMYLQVQGMA